MIRLEGLGKTYQTGTVALEVLKGIDLHVKSGEYIAIMGPSGSGKSTLMNIIGCLDRPTVGEYHLNGQPVSAMDEVELAGVRNREIGFIFQHFHLLPRMTAQHNVELPLIYSGVTWQERRERALEALEKVGLSDRAHHRPAELSGGQQQRVAIARALVNRPRLLLADEPTGALDTASGKRVLDLFEQLHDEGRTVVVITHDPDVGERAQRQIRLRDGEIVADSAMEREGTS
ncbi:ABC transporter ATP-binding protein [Desmospora activa]|uniref:Putative ABC transport system ATP-binding protein n=1 Tax=Desmospora activa DSM 45169 TaxID=1121389 RepID=A0A2T4Z1U8_9BACL|nr:ABC transporter ATP-binding protein [Desmospora activa]PTM54749.1 putative ABC transport system ATP-binding protein [Desmospora activa DSM 45169]